MNAHPGQASSSLRWELVVAIASGVATSVITLAVARLTDAAPTVFIGIAAFVVVAFAVFLGVRSDRARMVVVAAVGIAIGFGIALSILWDDPRVTVRIAVPTTGEVRCSPEVPNACVFEVSGTHTGFDPVAQRLYVFVYPTKPAGAGWYPQRTPGVEDGPGRWAQHQSQIGNGATPAEDGDQLQLRAAVVRKEATLDGVPLADVQGGKVVAALQDIDGFVAESPPVTLTVRR
jgi:hypothetical protein